MMRQRSGFTMTEMVIVIGILGVLASIIFPVIAESRMKARVAQCTSNLRQLGQALVMYDTEHDRVYENYPDRLTHLYAMGYAPDVRIFVCPMDSTKATTSSISGTATLKPVYSTSVPVDDKHDWAERTWNVPVAGMREQNCSYLYEFSTRDCQRWEIDPATSMAAWVPSSPKSWVSDWIVSWHSDDELFDKIYDDYYGTEGVEPFGEVPASIDGSIIYPAYPKTIDRDASATGGMLTWQEAKFAQLDQGDVYTNAIAYPGDRGVPEKWSDEPYFEDYRHKGYPRTWMPIVRCFWHCSAEMIDFDDMYDPENVLNLAIDGNTFYSVPGWEQTSWKYGRQAYPDW